MSDCCNTKDGNSKNQDFSLEGLICYCFLKSKNELHEAINSNTEEGFVVSIKEQMKKPGCFCETANPAGKCCLQDVKDFIAHYKK